MLTRPVEAVAASAQGVPGAACFLSELASLLGLSPSQRAGLIASGSFCTPSGFVCRVLKAMVDGQPRHRLEMELCMHARELEGDEVVRFLSLQSHLLEEGAWYLGMSARGMIQLYSLAWCRLAAEFVDALDAGQTVAMGVIFTVTQAEFEPVVAHH